MPVDQLAPRRSSSRNRRAAQAAARAAAARRRRRLIGGLGAALLLVTAVVVAIVVQTQRTATAPHATTPRNSVDAGTAFAVGPATAPVTLDVYEDFQCPVCARFERLDAATLAGLAAGGDAVVRYHPIAILDRVSPDRYSTRALNAAAVVADAAGPAAFVRFAGLLYEQQPAEGSPGLTDDELVALAAKAGAGGPEVARGIRDLTFEDWTRAVTDRASRRGVAGTPTVLINGEPVAPGELEPAALAAAVRAAG